MAKLPLFRVCFFKVCFFTAFYLNDQFDVFHHTAIGKGIDAPFGSIDSGFKITTTSFSF